MEVDEPALPKVGEESGMAGEQETHENGGEFVDIEEATLKKLKEAEVKEELSKHGQSTQGLKAVLLEQFAEKSVFLIWVDLLLCRSIQLLVLSYAEMFVYMYLSQLMSTFTKLSKGASSSRWFLQSMTRRTSDSTITHMYLYTHVSQI